MRKYDHLKDALQDGMDAVLQHWGDARRQYAKAANRAEEMWDSAGEHSRQTLRETRTYLHRHPLRAMSVALLAGMAVGAVFAYRRDD